MGGLGWLSVVGWMTQMSGWADCRPEEVRNEE